MKKTILLLLIFFCITEISAQCSVAVTYNPTPINTSESKVTGQTFKPTCTGKLANITFPKISQYSDDLPSSGYSIGIRLRDAANNILADGFWANGKKTTDQWRSNATNIVADFQCSNVTLVSGNTYTWEIYDISPNGQTDFALILFNYVAGTTYADGAYIKDGTVTNYDLVGWTVNVTTSVNALNASQSQTNPSNATATDGSASVSNVVNGVSGATTTYIWKKNGTIISGATGSSISNLGVGTYTCDITKGCTITKTFNLQAGSLAVDESQQQRKTNFSPNPVKDFLQFSRDQKSVEIFDLTGKKLNVPFTKTTADLSKLPAGNYIVRATDEKGNVSSQKVVKK